MKIEAAEARACPAEIEGGRSHGPGHKSAMMRDEGSFMGQLEFELRMGTCQRRSQLRRSKNHQDQHNAGTQREGNEEKTFGLMWLLKPTINRA